MKSYKIVIVASSHFRSIPFDNAAIAYVSMKPNKISVILDNKQC
jgi:hypothetical protein